MLTFAYSRSPGRESGLSRAAILSGPRDPLLPSAPVGLDVAQVCRGRFSTKAKELSLVQASVPSPGGLFAELTRVLADPGVDPTESQRGCPRLPLGARDASILNTRCPPVPLPAPRSLGLEMRYTASSGIEGSNPSRSAFPL